MTNNEVKLIFVGSLSFHTNILALDDFSKNYYPLLRNYFGNKLIISVVGRNPSNYIKKMCRKNNWKLFPNVSYEKLEELLRISNYSILPFRVTTGLKLKALESLKYKTALLANSIIKEQFDKTLDISYIGSFSDDVDDWINFINNFDQKKFEENILPILEFYNWRNINLKFKQIINKISHKELS